MNDVPQYCAGDAIKAWLKETFKRQSSFVNITITHDNWAVTGSIYPGYPYPNPPGFEPVSIYIYGPDYGCLPLNMVGYPEITLHLADPEFFQKLECEIKKESYRPSITKQHSLAVYCEP